MPPEPSSIPLYQVDAFSDRPFRGNPAAVCPLEAWLPAEAMQAVAGENNLSETAFFVPEGEGFRLRWFTPRSEVDLCGHATLASAFVLFEKLDPGRSEVRFESRSGPLWVRRRGELLELDFPALPAVPCDAPAGLREGLGRQPDEVLQARETYMAVFARQEDVAALRPDFARLEALHPRRVMATAPGEDVDFVSRYFAPAMGIPEDPVTGSAHSTLAPYWGARLGRTELTARQISARGGELWCRLEGERVAIAGRAVLVLEGRLFL